jgi:PAS domain S-box-containing protein
MKSGNRDKRIAENRYDVYVNERPVKILLVDDRPENLVALEASLEGVGGELVLAGSGTEALRHLLNEEFAAVLLDVKMPDMDGFETAELIRSRPRSRQIPIIFLTAYRSDAHLFRGYDLGAVDFLFKPIIPEILRSKVSVFVELSRNAGVLREQAAVLKREEEKLRCVLEAAPDGMVMCRKNGAIVLVNSRLEALFHYSRHELLGRRIDTIIPDWDLSAPADGQAGTYSDGVVHGRELTGVRRDGTTFPVEISLNSFEDLDGTLLITAIRDVSDRKRVDEEIRSLNSELEKRVQRRTEELLRSNEELAQFAYAASHDIQEPMRVVSLYAQLLDNRLRGQLRGEATQYLGYISENARRMQDVVKDVLALSRLDSQGDEHFSKVDCNIALNESLANLEPKIIDTSARIVSDRLPVIWGDALQIARIFQNLIGNAITYRSEAEPEIRIKLDSTESEWLFSVEDNGIGIPPDYHEIVFGLFKRLHSRSDYPGTGLGLAICKKIVTYHGGRIWVESELGSGSTFRFTLPRHQLQPPGDSQDHKANNDNPSLCHAL